MGAAATWHEALERLQLTKPWHRDKSDTLFGECRCFLDLVDAAVSRRGHCLPHWPALRGARPFRSVRRPLPSSRATGLRSAGGSGSRRGASRPSLPPRLRLRLRPVTAVADASGGEGRRREREEGQPRRTNESVVVMGGKTYTNFPLG